MTTSPLTEGNFYTHDHDNYSVDIYPYRYSLDATQWNLPALCKALPKPNKQGSYSRSQVSRSIVFYAPKFTVSALGGPPPRSPTTATSFDFHAVALKVRIFRTYPHPHFPPQVLEPLSPIHVCLIDPNLHPWLIDPSDHVRCMTLKPPSFTPSC